MWKDELTIVFHLYMNMIFVRISEPLRGTSDTHVACKELQRGTNPDPMKGLVGDLVPSEISVDLLLRGPQSGVKRHSSVTMVRMASSRSECR